MNSDAVLKMIKYSMFLHDGITKKIMRDYLLEKDDVISEFFLYLSDHGLLLPVEFGSAYVARCYFFYGQNRLKKREIKTAPIDYQNCQDDLDPEKIFLLFDDEK